MKQDHMNKYDSWILLRNMSLDVCSEIKSSSFSVYCLHEPQINYVGFWLLDGKHILLICVLHTVIAHLYIFYDWILEARATNTCSITSKSYFYGVINFFFPSSSYNKLSGNIYFFFFKLFVSNLKRHSVFHD